MFTGLISQETFHTLAGEAETPLVTVVLPFHNEGSQANENARRLHAALAGLEQQLAAFGLSPKGCGQFLAPARAYADEQLGKPKGDETLVLFLSPSMFKAFVLPGSLPEMAVVGRHFAVAPLLPRLHKHASCFLLPLSKKHVHLLLLSEEGMKEVAVDGMPKNYTLFSAGNEPRQESSQSKAGPQDTSKLDLQAYIRKVTKHVDDALKGRHEPLIFVGIDEEWGMFRQAIGYSHVIDSSIGKNPETISAEELEAGAVEMLAPLWDKEKAVVLESYGSLAGTGRTSVDLQAILDLAANGKVDTLLVAEGVTQWGAVHVDSGVAALHERQENGDEELISLAAVHALRHKGWVQSFPLAQMPEGKMAAAILRY